MRLTNNYGLPEPIVEAIRRDPYSAGDCDISCTTLVGPPMIRVLEKIHDDEIEEDAADRIWALLGQSVHVVLERAGARQPMAEHRLFATFGPWTVSGQVDLMDNGRVLSDYKLTSVWAVKLGIKAEWEAQLNVLAELARRNGHDPRKLEVVAMLRDWRKGEALRYGADYPEAQVAVLPVEMWSPERATAYIEERLRLHFDETDDAVCTPEERWDKPTTYAVMSRGRKTAHRVLESAAEAEDWMTANGKGDSIEVRPGESTRCLHYCSVRRWCPYGASL